MKNEVMVNGQVITLEDVDFTKSTIFNDYMSRQYVNYDPSKVKFIGFDFMGQERYCYNSDYKFIPNYDYLEECSKAKNYYLPYNTWDEFILDISNELGIPVNELIMNDKELAELYAEML